MIGVPTTRDTLNDQAGSLACEIAELFADAAQWNAAYPDQEPIDPDPNGQLRRIYDALVGMLRVEDARTGARRMIQPLIPLDTTPNPGRTP